MGRTWLPRIKDRERKDEELTEEAYECFDKNVRQKHTAKFSEDDQNALVKFQTTEEQEIEAHLEKLTIRKLLFIEKNIQFGKRATDSLHASRVNKNKKIDRKQWQQQKLKFLKDVWM
ncbi:hypothetical protein scyTo_0002592 [Scyliorhinus torazame]|uniref:Uncharacterized protein n=1 Tax=Scyliorhinus torazame TaxID=75743 RepID=A0A401PK63_SCYTO|nr:hypothetical protein [Scyliorhinus torazame]